MKTSPSHTRSLQNVNALHRLHDILVIIKTLKFKLNFTAHFDCKGWGFLQGDTRGGKYFITFPTLTSSGKLQHDVL